MPQVTWNIDSSAESATALDAEHSRQLKNVKNLPFELVKLLTEIPESHLQQCLPRLGSTKILFLAFYP